MLSRQSARHICFDSSQRRQLSRTSLSILEQPKATSASQEPKVSVQPGQATKDRPHPEELLPGTVAPLSTLLLDPRLRLQLLGAPGLEVASDESDFEHEDEKAGTKWKEGCF